MGRRRKEQAQEKELELIVVVGDSAYKTVEPKVISNCLQVAQDAMKATNYKFAIYGTHVHNGIIWEVVHEAFHTKMELELAVANYESIGVDTYFIMKGQAYCNECS